MRKGLRLPTKLNRHHQRKTPCAPEDLPPPDIKKPAKCPYCNPRLIEAIDSLGKVPVHKVTPLFMGVGFPPIRFLGVRDESITRKSRSGRERTAVHGTSKHAPLRPEMITRGPEVATRERLSTGPIPGPALPFFLSRDPGRDHQLCPRAGSPVVPGRDHQLKK